MTELEQTIGRIVDEKLRVRRQPRITRQRRRLTLEDVAAMDDGPSLTAYDLERITRGQISDETIRRECERGVLPARVEHRGQMKVMWISFAVAKGYLQKRGLLQ